MAFFAGLRPGSGPQRRLVPAHHGRGDHQRPDRHVRPAHRFRGTGRPLLARLPPPSAGISRPPGGISSPIAALAGDPQRMALTGRAQNDDFRPGGSSSLAASMRSPPVRRRWPQPGRQAAGRFSVTSGAGSLLRSRKGTCTEKRACRNKLNGGPYRGSAAFHRNAYRFILRR
jgi:hypothetical protein